MKDVAVNLAECYKCIGESIQDVINENYQLRLQTQEKDNALTAMKIQYKNDIGTLRDQVYELELINSEFREILSNMSEKRPEETHTGNEPKRLVEQYPYQGNNQKDSLEEYHSNQLFGNNISRDLLSSKETQTRICSNSISEEQVIRPAPTKIMDKKDFSVDSKNSSSQILDNESQIFMLPTQYSSQRSSEENGATSNPVEFLDKIEDEGDNFEEIEDSQDEQESGFEVNPSADNFKREPLADLTSAVSSQSNIPASPPVPKYYTPLQRRAFLTQLFSRKYNSSPMFRIDLTRNPINESEWLINDFKPNPKYSRPYKVQNFGLTKKENQDIRRFHELAGPVKRRKIGENTDPHGNSAVLSESQVYDKFPSPPGFMISEFPDTQEKIERNKIVDARQLDRIKRRLFECLGRSHGRQGEFIFRIDILNKFVELKRFVYKE